MDHDGRRRESRRSSASFVRYAATQALMEGQSHGQNFVSPSGDLAKIRRSVKRIRRTLTVIECGFCQSRWRGDMHLADQHQTASTPGFGAGEAAQEGTELCIARSQCRLRYPPLTTPCTRVQTEIGALCPSVQMNPNVPGTRSSCTMNLRAHDPAICHRDKRNCFPQVCGSWQARTNALSLGACHAGQKCFRLPVRRRCQMLGQRAAHALCQRGHLRPIER